MKSFKKIFDAALIAGFSWGLMIPSITYSGTNDNTGLNKGIMSQLSAEWWQWSLSIPYPVNPLSIDWTPEQAAEYCGVGQHGNTWFIGGFVVDAALYQDNDPNNDPVIPDLIERNCTIPPNTALFFPVINAECSAIEGNGETKTELKDCASGLIDLVDEVVVEIDGSTLKGLKQSRVQSDLFYFTLPPHDVLGLYGHEPNPSRSVADGYYALLKPLSPGGHTIKIFGTVPDFGFTLNVKYTITVLAN